MTNCIFLGEGVNFVWKPLKMKKTERATLKEAIMQRLSEEVDAWLDKQQDLTSGYEYETEFMKVAQKVNRIILEKSLGEQPVSRNDKKKSTPALEK